MSECCLATVSLNPGTIYQLPVSVPPAGLPTFVPIYRFPDCPVCNVTLSVMADRTGATGTGVITVTFLLDNRERCVLDQIILDPATGISIDGATFTICNLEHACRIVAVATS